MMFRSLYNSKILARKLLRRDSASILSILTMEVNREIQSFKTLTKMANKVWFLCVLVGFNLLK